MQQSNRLEGIIPPMSTPLTGSGDVDKAGVAELTEFFVDAGVSGLFVLGTSGEAPYLTNAQRFDVIRAATDTCGGRLPVLAGIIDTGADRVIEQGRAAQEAGADYVVAAPPFYARGNDEEIYRHYELIHSAISIPLVAYNIPSRTNIQLSVNLVGQLADDGVIVGIKDSSGDFSSFRQLVQSSALRTQFSIMTGSDLFVDIALFIGAHGAVPGLANIDPHGYVRLYEAGVQQDWTEARQEQDRLSRLFSIIRLGQEFGIGPDAAAAGGFKAALNLRGIVRDPAVAAPQSALPAGARSKIEKLLAELNLL